MTKSDTSLNNISQATNNAAIAARNASDAASEASKNAAIAAKAAAESATAIAVVATDTSWMKKSLGGIEEKLNEMDKAFVTAAQHSEVLAQLKDHEDRIRKIEDNLGKWIGAAGVIIFLITVAVSFLVKLIK